MLFIVHLSFFKICQTVACICMIHHFHEFFKSKFLADFDIRTNCASARTNQKRLGCVALVGALFLSVLCRRRVRHAASRALKTVQQTALSGFEATPLYDARCVVLPWWPARLCSLTARAQSSSALSQPAQWTTTE